MQDDEWKKVTEARGPWTAIKNRSTEEWPSWVDKFDTQVRAWLHGESIQYAVFGFEQGDDEYADNALESTMLTATILSAQFVLRAQVPKLPNARGAGVPSIVVVSRRAITSLSIEPQTPHPSFGPAFVTRAEFDGIDGVLEIPQDPSTWYMVPEEDRAVIASTLRDDLLLNRP